MNNIITEKVSFNSITQCVGLRKILSFTTFSSKSVCICYNQKGYTLAASSFVPANIVDNGYIYIYMNYSTTTASHLVGQK